MIFKWYGVDFGANTEEVGVCNREICPAQSCCHDHVMSYLFFFQVAKKLHSLMGDGEKKNTLGEVINGKFKTHFIKYDWGVNS